ncbi:MAG: hypothetical protein IJQ28_02775, partial [Clostridia bacterium]|nr:hypothetical protein [Clostridia bacterium]
MKKIVSTILAVIMLYSCISTMSFAMTDSQYKQYEPIDFVLSSRGGVASGYKLSWKNPVQSGLTKVTVYSVDESNASQVIASPTAGAITVVNVLAGKDYGYFSFKLVYEFSDGAVREVYQTLRGEHDNAATFSASAGMEYYHKNGSGARTKARGYIVNDENATPSGTKSLKVISNRQSAAQDAEENGNRYLLRFNKSIYTAMQAGVSYKLSMKVKTSTSETFEIRTGDYAIWHVDIENLNTNNAWQTVERTFTVKGDAGSTSTYGGLILSFVGLKAPVYFDDIKVIKTSDSSVVIDQNFEAVSTTVSAPTNISSVSGDKSVTFSWNTVNNDTRFYNVYERLSDGTYILRARTKHTDAGITLSNLENDKTYTFAVTGSALIGIERPYTEEISVTPSDAVFVPTNVMAEPLNCAVRFSWDPLVGNTKYVNIYEKKENETLEKKTQIGVDKTEAVVTGLINDQEYTFVIKGASDTKETEGVEIKVTPKET